MAKVCAICQKGSLLFGKYNKLRGKYNPVHVKIRKYPNLQWFRVPKNPQEVSNKKFRPFAGQRISACAKCIKSLGKNK